MFSILDLFFPKICVGCGKWGTYVCSKCRLVVRQLLYLKCPVCEKPAIDGMTHPGCQTKYGIDGLTSFFRYDGVVKKAIKEIKYRLVTDLTHELFDCISLRSWNLFILIRNSLLLPAGRHGDSRYSSAIVPIPLHRSRFNERGFNQAEVIGRELSKRINIPLETKELIRIKKTIPQVAMKTRDDRLNNIKNVFSSRNSNLATRFSSVILVDDVFTTGATLRSAATVLKHAGVKFVWGVTIAQ